MAARHRARSGSIQIMKVAIVPANKCRRPHVTNLHVRRGKRGRERGREREKSGGGRRARVEGKLREGSRFKRRIRGTQF